ncbi:SDR family NAD(P)-dependent oxidoreductase [Burkholderia plantarii]|uniref:Putative short-chain dehydrogenase/reductase SDR n=1 Tax=Burkholderia plantarii TaxID=41899 RepID=A0A0B6RY25_BURPL|nr:SDR family NAD(P)-dependent oxidoreductase [Burkholderia plantarii]AJK48288.1 putative short-chain dehydrogenase/reductase SDR [Burkholderia plantarii]
MTSESTVLIVGASRGLGLALAGEYCRLGWRVIATVRGESTELAALAARHPGRLEIETGVEIADPAGLRALHDRLAGRTLDLLFVNAGIARSIELTPATAPEHDFLEMMRVNAFSPVRLVEMFEDRVAADGTIAIMSSELASIAGNDGAWDLYASSKAALNMLVKCHLARRPDNRRAVLLVAPGWVRTEMGGSEASLSIEESIPRVVEMVARQQGRAGLRFVDRFGATLPW